MKLFMRFIGVAVLGFGLLGLTAGCGKKMVRGSSGVEQGTARATLQAAPGEQVLASLSNLDQSRVSLNPGHPGLAGDQDLTGSEVGGENRQLGRDRRTGFPQESTNHAMLTTPASTSSSRYNPPFTSSALPSTDSYTGNSGMTQSQFGYEGQGDDGLSQQQTQRKGVTFSNGLRDIHFQFDSWRLTEESRRILEANAEWLKVNEHQRIKIEGHCDERGTQAYNFVLGEKRASMVQQYLSFLGVPHHQLIVTSFGKDKPECHAFSETCFQKNRRAHFASDLNVAVH